MKMLLAAGADPELRSQHDWTPMMHAAYRGDVESADLLLQSGASFEDISSRDETVLLLASAAGSEAIVRRLLELGCAPESEWSKRPVVNAEPSGGSSGSTQQQRIERVYTVGWTPLMVACQVGSLEIVKMLLDAGANPEPKSPLFKTALDIAKEQGWPEIVNYLTPELDYGPWRTSNSSDSVERFRRAD